MNFTLQFTQNNPLPFQYLLIVQKTLANLDFITLVLNRMRHFRRFYTQRFTAVVSQGSVLDSSCER